MNFIKEKIKSLWGRKRPIVIEKRKDLQHYLLKILQQFKSDTIRVEPLFEQTSQSLSEFVVEHPTGHHILTIVPIDGPYQYVVKLINTANLRSIRIEVPKEENKWQTIMIRYLERTANVVKNLDNFYIGESTAVDYHDYAEVIDMAESGEFFTDWLFEKIDRSQDLDMAHGIMMQNIYDKPTDHESVCVGVIETVKPVDIRDTEVTLDIRLKGCEGVLRSTVTRASSKRYKSGRIFVINQDGVHVSFMFGKAKKFIKFSRDDWELLKTLTYQGYRRAGA